MCDPFAGHSTPPFTPPQNVDFAFDALSFNSNTIDADVVESKIQKYCTFRWFNCRGEAETNAKLDENHFLCNGEEDFIVEEFEPVPGFCDSCEMGTVELFGYNFDKGASLLLDLDVLFKMALSNFMALNTQLSLPSSGPLLPFRRIGVPESQHLNTRQMRMQLVQFFIHIRHYLIHLATSLDSETEAIVKHFSRNLCTILKRFRRTMRKLVDLPECVCNNAARPHKSSMIQPSHHVFHSHLELRWLHLTTLHLVHKISNNIEKRKKNDNEKNRHMEWDSEVDEELCASVTLLDAINLCVSDLVQLAIMRFEKLGAKNAMHLPAFNCSCVQELWILLQVLSRDLEKSDCDISDSNQSKYSFWTIVNNVLFKVCDKKDSSGCNRVTDKSVMKTDANENFNCSAPKKKDTNVPENFSCSTPNLFNLWLVKSLSHSFTRNSREIPGNYVLLVKILKEDLKDECSEAHLRLLLPAVHFLVVDLWEPQNEAVLILWEYYQKRLNCSFYVLGETLETVSVIPRSSEKLIAQVYDRLDNDRQLCSFQKFVRLLGLHLRRTMDDQKFWNQLKGRIYSKFPGSKMIALTALGVYNFVSTFLTIAVVKTNEIGEICKKLQDFLELTNKDDTAVRGLVFLTHLTILDLLARNQVDFSMCSTPLVKFLNHLDLRHSENIHLITSGMDSLRPLFSGDNIQLGLPNLVGDWIHQYLIATNHDVGSSKLVYFIDGLLVEMKSKTYRIFGSPEVETFEALWNQIKTLITSEDFTPANSSDCLGRLCANFAIVSTKIYRSATMLRDVANIVSNSTKLSVNTLRDFLSTLIDYKPLPMALRDHDTFILKSWMHCEIFDWRTLSGTCDKLSVYVAALPDCVSLNFQLNTKEPLISFCKSLNQRFMSLTDAEEKREMHDKTRRYFDSVKQWVEPVLKSPIDVNLVKRVYLMVGHIIDSAGVFLYAKGQSNSALQALIDLLLLPLPIRRPGFQLQAPLLAAVNESLHLYVEGLVKLKKEGDAYLTKVIQDLIVIYLPKCVELSHRSELKLFSLTQSFRPTLEGSSRDVIMKTILETVRIYFVKPRARIPAQECRQAIKFLQNVVVTNKYDSAILSAMFKHILGNICCIMMYSEDTSAAKREANNLMVAILDCDPIRADKATGEEVMKLFSVLCQEHLAFNSRQLFALFHLLSTSGPDFVYRSLPQLEKAVAEVERKRGQGHDRVLRAEFQHLCKALNYNTTTDARKP